MVRRNLIVLAAVALTAMTPADRLNPAPPGTVVQNLTAYLAGDGMNSRYHVVASRKQLGGPDDVQWYLSVYAPGGERGASLAFSSPAANGPDELVPRIEKGHGTSMYFPRETLEILGKGEFMGEARDQALVRVSAAGADCGSVTVAVIDADGGMVHVGARVENGCALSAKIEHHAIVLSGPYYAKNSALCCPAKAHATATLRYVDGRWVEKPNYFRLIVPRRTETPLTHPTPLFTPIFKSVIGTPAPSGPPQPPH